MCGHPCSESINGIITPFKVGSKLQACQESVSDPSDLIHSLKVILKCNISYNSKESCRIWLCAIVLIMNLEIEYFIAQ